tara:strand:- start:307 stop:819 length:513 start_codon:yes stop_codon:yes gene_type:complete
MEDNSTENNSEDNSTENKCIICLSNIDLTDTENYKLECGHIYHTKCIISWFRTATSSGRCPMCNDNNIDDNLQYLSWYNRDYVLDRFRVIKNTNKKNHSNKLKKELDKVKKLEDELKDFNLERKDFYKKDETKEFIKQDKKYKNMSWKKQQKILKQKTKIVAQFPLITSF